MECGFSSIQNHIFRENVSSRVRETTVPEKLPKQFTKQPARLFCELGVGIAKNGICNKNKVASRARQITFPLKGDSIGAVHGLEKMASRARETSS